MSPKNTQPQELQASFRTNNGRMPPIFSHYLSASLQTKSLEDRMQMILDCADRDTHFDSDLLVAPTRSKRPTHLTLPGSQCPQSVFVALHCCHFENLAFCSLQPYGPGLAGSDVCTKRRPICLLNA